jgi:taurine dioxygenase
MGADWNHADALKWRQLAPFGAEIDHNLGVLQAEAEIACFVALFRRHGLILARGQTLSMPQQQQLMAHLGALMQRTNESGYITTETGHASGTVAYPFHSDGAYTAKPFEALSLHAIDVVDDASSTRFINAERGYETLPPALRARLESHAAEMIKSTYDTVGVRAFETAQPVATRFDERPSIRIHPHNGRKYVAVSEMQTSRLLGMAWEDSRALLSEVFDHLYAPAQVSEHVWRKGDIVIWDNIALQHARGSLEKVGRRVLQRVIVGGEDC